MLQECTALEPKGLLPVDPPLYIIIPLFSEGKSGQLAVWEIVRAIYKQLQSPFHLTLTIKSKPTPHSITPTSLGSISSESSVARVTGVGGHSAHWSLTSSPHIVADHSIGWYNEVRTGGGWFSGYCVHCIKKGEATVKM